MHSGFEEAGFQERSRCFADTHSFDIVVEIATGERGRETGGKLSRGVLLSLLLATQLDGFTVFSLNPLILS